GTVVQLEQGLLADDDRRGQLDEPRASRRRFLASRLDPLLQAVVIEGECGGGATDAVLADQPDRQVPQRLGNPSAAGRRSRQASSRDWAWARSFGNSPR